MTTTATPPTGEHLIAGRWLPAECALPFHALEQATGRKLDPPFRDADAVMINRAFEAADRAFLSYSTLPDTRRARFLSVIAEELLASKEALIARAQQETALSRERLEGECARTCHQLQRLAEMLENEPWREARVDEALPERQPLPRPELRRELLALGPVAVFGASNFPLAFSVAGGDTAAALAAGCPVVFKAHEAHPGTSELAARAISRALEREEIPPGVFSMLHGCTAEVGRALVLHPLATAVAFTGSLKVGRSICDAAAARPVPIPVFAEMGSVNPVFIFPEALKQRGSEIGQALASSITLSAGQFCTKPGLIFAIRGSELEAFLQSLTTGIALTPAATMLQPRMATAFYERTAELKRHEGLALIAQGREEEGPSRVAAQVWQIDAAQYRQAAETFQSEIFGPVALVVTAGSLQEYGAILQEMEGQLTATLYAEADEIAQAAEWLPLLTRKAGRLILNGVPTGVEVAAAMTHGGPYPASSDARFTAVGTAAIMRFLRPITFQNFPQKTLAHFLSPR